MIRRLLFLAALAFLSIPAAAQYGSYQNWCETGGQTVNTSGIQSLTTVQISAPKCAVTVYVTGTPTLAVLFTNVGGSTPLANPLCANSNGSFLFYAPQSAQYDIVLSNSPSCNPPPATQLPLSFTFWDVSVSGLGGGSGGGTVTVIDTTSPILGGPITSSGTLSFATSGVTPGFYANANITVNSFGLVTSAASGAAGTINGATPNGGLVATGTTLGLLLTCSINQSLIWNGTAWICGGGTGVTGSGTSGTITEWASASSLGNSPIVDGGVAGISIANPITGAFSVNTASSGATLVVGLAPTYLSAYLGSSPIASSTSAGSAFVQAIGGVSSSVAEAEGVGSATASQLFLHGYNSLTAGQQDWSLGDTVGNGVAGVDSGNVSSPAGVQMLLATGAQWTILHGTTVYAAITSTGMTLNGTGCGAGKYILSDGTGCGAGTALSFGAITAGTNTSALLMGSGGSFSYTGTGLVNANQLLGSTLPPTATGNLCWTGSAWSFCSSPGSGTVTSVGLVGTSGQITVTGASPITATGSWTLSFPTSVSLTNLTVGGTLTFLGNVLPSSLSAGNLCWTGSAWAFCASSGSGTVTAFSSGNLSPLFTTSVATATSTPALSFSLSNAAATTLFGNCSGSTGAPSYCYAVGSTGTDIPQLASGLLLSSEIPNNAANTTGNAANVTGVVAAANGGLGIATVPSAGQVPAGNSGGTAYAPVTLSQDATLTSAGVVTVVGLKGVTLPSLAAGYLNYTGSAWALTNPLASPTLSGTITLSAITGSTQCLQVNSSGVLSGTGLACGSGSGGLPSVPSTPVGSVYSLVAAAAGSAAWALPGIAGRSVTGSTDTIGIGDCSPNRVEYTSASNVAVTLPTATTLGNAACVFKLANQSAAVVTVTPTTWTINGNATLALLGGQDAFIYVDPASTTNWSVDVYDAVISAGTNVTLTRTATSVTINASGGGGGGYTPPSTVGQGGLWSNGTPKGSLTGGTTASPTNTTMWVQQLIPIVQTIVGHATFAVTACASCGETVVIGIYTSTSSAPAWCASATVNAVGNYSAAASQYTLQPGTLYYIAYEQSGTAAATWWSYNSGASYPQQIMLHNNSTMYASAANLASGTSCPSTLGTLTSNDNVSTQAMILLEP